jgi:uncharacterized protein with PIN domain
MTDIIRRCPDCRSALSLGQHHSIADWCPDTADEYCPEWYCQVCGTALLIGEVPAGRGSVRMPAVRDRVA